MYIRVEGLLGAYCIQWNPSNLDTLGAEDSVLIIEVSGVQEWYILLAVGKSVYTVLRDSADVKNRMGCTVIHVSS